MRKSLLLLLSLLPGTLARAVPPAAPTDVVAYAPNQNRAHLTWTDNATDETSYLIDLWVPDPPDPENPGAPETGTWTRLDDGELPENSEVYRGGAESSDEQVIRYRVAPFKTGEDEQMLNWVEAEVTKPSGPLDLLYTNGNTNIEVPEGSEARAGSGFSLQLEVYGGTPDQFVAQGLPNGANLVASTGLVSGVIADEGVYRFIYGVEFDGGKRFEQVHYLRVLPAASTPEVANPTFNLPAQDAGVNGFLDITGLFRDPARPDGAWFDTSLGSFIVALFDQATPKTVNNFLDYVASNSYNNSYLHRAQAGFVIQGGGAKPASSTATPVQWMNIPKIRTVPNEAGISNRRGTIAMAKSGTTDSATSEWFVSVGANNPNILDRQVSGFTAFGEVVGAGGMTVVDALSQRPTGNYSGQITGTTGTLLSQVPVLDASAPATPGTNSLVRIFSISEVEPVSIVVAANSNPAVIQAEVFGQALYLNSPGATGTSNVTLRATNLDGISVDFVLPVTIDDFSTPGVRLLSIKGTRPLGMLLVRGRATDNSALGNWRYRVNRGRWLKGGGLSGKSATLKKKMGPFRRGGNIIEIEVFDKKGNRSGVLKQRFKLG